jgi:hypothetical protein
MLTHFLAQITSAGEDHNAGQDVLRQGNNQQDLGFKTFPKDLPVH